MCWWERRKKTITPSSEPSSKKNRPKQPYVLHQSLSGRSYAQTQDTNQQSGGSLTFWETLGVHLRNDRLHGRRGTTRRPGFFENDIGGTYRKGRLFLAVHQEPQPRPELVASTREFLAQRSLENRGADQCIPPGGVYLRSEGHAGEPQSLAL